MKKLIVDLILGKNIEAKIIEDMIIQAKKQKLDLIRGFSKEIIDNLNSWNLHKKALIIIKR